jgi:hypothetical protein
MNDKYEALARIMIAPRCRNGCYRYVIDGRQLIMKTVSLAMLPSIKYWSAIDAGASCVSSGIEFTSSFHPKRRWDLSLIVHFHSFDQPTMRSRASSNGINLSQRHYFVRLLYIYINILTEIFRYILWAHEGDDYVY